MTNFQRGPGFYYDPVAQDQIKTTMATMKAVTELADDPTNNVVLSAHNIMDCFTLVALGAEGNTKAEIADRLFLAKPEELDEKVAKFVALNDAMLKNAQGQVKLLTARTIWPNSDFGAVLRPEYKEKALAVLRATIDPRSFANPETKVVMDRWASDHTEKLITKIVDNLDPRMKALMASALYYKGEWTSKFDKSNTKDKLFSADHGGFMTPIMHRYDTKTDVLTYQEGDDYEAVSMTYGAKDYAAGKVPPVRMVMVRPESGSARQWLAKQPDDAVPAFLDTAMFEEATGVFEMPRIDTKQGHKLIPVLSKMGIRDLFSEFAANLSGMFSGGQNFVSQVQHDVVFLTDEEGSKAAAITSIGARCTSISLPPRRIDVRLDRSFLFAIQDIRTGGVLFSGIINKPNKDMTPVLVP